MLFVLKLVCKGKCWLIFTSLDAIQAGCLSIEDEIIDATTEEGKRYLREVDEAAGADSKPTGSTVTPSTEAIVHPK